VRVTRCNGATVEVPEARMASGASATNSAAYLWDAVGVARAPAVVDLYVMADSPPQSLQPLCERREAGMPLRIVGGPES
jgi:hypothetical protein